MAVIFVVSWEKSCVVVDVHFVCVCRDLYGTVHTGSLGLHWRK